MDNNFNVKLVSATDFVNKDEYKLYENLNDRYNYYGGIAAGICYMPSDFDAVKNAPIEKILSRADMVKGGGHHSVFDHSYVSLYLENIPKLFAMLLNNEQLYTTSEKSARYTTFQPTGKELECYEKWKEVFKQKIAAKYGQEEYFSKNRINKLALENARYMLSIYNPTNLLYTCSYRQLNYMCKWLQNLDKSSSSLLQNLAPYAEKFCTEVKNLHLLDDQLMNDQKNRFFSLVTDKDYKEYFGDVYCAKYDSSLAIFAQAQRHRTIDYSIKEKQNKEFYIPKLIRNDKELTESWLDDLQSLDNAPQATLVEVIERGTPEKFILKTKERFCTAAQLEINDQTKDTLNKYIKNCEDEALKNYLKQYAKGARCTGPDYKCSQPCHFRDGILMEREI